MKSDHGVIGYLNNSQIIEILIRGNLGHLACAHNREIYVVPVSYVYDNEIIYSHSKPGKKIQLMMENPSVCFQVEEIENFFKWKSIIVNGRFELLKDDEAARGRRLLKLRRETFEEFVPPLEFEFDTLLESSLIYRIQVQTMTGRFEGSL